MVAIVKGFSEFVPYYKTYAQIHSCLSLGLVMSLACK